MKNLKAFKGQANFLDSQQMVILVECENVTLDGRWDLSVAIQTAGEGCNSNAELEFEKGSHKPQTSEGKRNADHNEFRQAYNFPALDPTAACNLLSMLPFPYMNMIGNWQIGGSDKWYSGEPRLKDLEAMR